MTKIEQQQRDFCAEVALLKHKAGTLKMYKTMHSLEIAEKQVGWELAEILEGKAPYAK